MKILTTDIAVSDVALYLHKNDIDDQIKERIHSALFRKFSKSIEERSPQLIVLGPLLKDKKSGDLYTTYSQSLYVMDISEHRPAINTLHIPDDWIDTPYKYVETYDKKPTVHVSFPHVKDLVTELKKLFSI